MAAPYNLNDCWVDNGNRLSIRNSPQPDCTRMYAQYINAGVNQELCRVNKDGRMFRDGIDITDNDAAMIQCFVDMLNLFHKAEVKRGS